MRRQVRRWQSDWHRQQNAERLKEAQQVAWANWLAADWAWVLMDAGDAGDGPFEKLVPSLALPPRAPYSFGDGAAFDAAYWPDVLQRWPVQELATAAHPLGRKCNFALRRLSKVDIKSDADLREWEALRAYWQKAGLAQKKRALRCVPYPE